MKKEIKVISGKNVTVITADEGKEFVRRGTDVRYGNEIYLGMNYRTNPPSMDTPEDFEEVEENINN